MNTSEILNKAADLIEEQGWAQRCESGGVCVDQALSMVQADWLPLANKVKEYLGLGFFPLLYQWNDAPERTANEVIEVLRATALIEAVREGAPLSVLEPAPVHVSA